MAPTPPQYSAPDCTRSPLIRLSVARTAVLAILGCLALALLDLSWPPRSEATAGTFDYDVPVQPNSPWPMMRRDQPNTGLSPIRATYRDGEHPWSFRTGRGVFSTPVIGGNGTVYVGSADGYMYALAPDGELRWRFQTGGVIDSAAALGAYDPRFGSSTLTFGSGDELIYRLRKLGLNHLSRSQRIAWTFEPTRPPGAGQQVSWWEGNVVIGPGGTLYAGNTGGGLYAINPDGTLRWLFPTTNSVWSAAGIGDQGNEYFGSLDFFVHGLDPDGRQLWSRLAFGFVASSPAIGSDGTVYIGSFDGSLYALDPDTGAVRWTFPTDDHIYSSPALAQDGEGRTSAIYVGSADGSLYKLTPDGRLVWRYDTGDPIRSSPAIGRAPRGDGEIVYFGSANGKLYALDGADGSRRWSYDWTPEDPVLRDRNDLNASPALGERGIYIAGEHGLVVYVPYEWCLEAGATDPRCETDPGEEFPNDATDVYPVTPGGNTQLGDRLTDNAPAASSPIGRLVVRRGGDTLDAAMQGTAEGLVSPSPRFPFTAELSGDGHFIDVLPTGFLRPDTEYSLRFGGEWTAGDASGPFNDEIRFRTAPARLRRPPLHVKHGRVTALNLRRLAVPLPPFLPSVNQIGFDSYDWIVGTLDITPPDPRGEGRALFWVIGARKDPHGVSVADPASEFAFPLLGRYRRDSLILSARDLTLTFSFGPVPLHVFQLRGQLRRDLGMQGANMYSETVCADVPVYGPLLPLTGLCNQKGKLVASGTFVTDAYDRRGAANRRPQGLRIESVDLKRPGASAAGEAAATFSLRHGARYPASEHVASILLTAADSGEPVSLDYKAATSTTTDAAGNLTGVRVEIPPGTELPARVRVYVIADVFPLGAMTR
jgi:outer membrane protein assembly factor BamB